MPALHHLSQEQKKRLLKALKESENPYIRERILILLLMNDGKTYQEISGFLEISYPTVAPQCSSWRSRQLREFKRWKRER